MENQMRLNNYISATGLCSRREADTLIEEKRVKVNGVVAILGMRVNEEDEVELVIQVNGKIRSKMVVPFNAKQEDIQDKAFELIQAQLEGKTVRKVIYVPNKLLNVVVG